jgi:hypothetical protein
VIKFEIIYTDGVNLQFLRIMRDVCVVNFYNIPRRIFN